MAHGELKQGTSRFGFAMEDSLKEEVGKISAIENRSMSNVVKNAVENYVSLYEDRDLFQQYQELVFKSKH